MDSYNYFLLVFDNFFIYLFCTIIIFFIYFLIFRKYYLSLLDPFTYVTFFSAFASTVPVFLFVIKEIQFNLFLSFLITQVSFFLGFHFFSPLKIKRISLTKIASPNSNEIRFVKWLFIVVGLSNIFFQIYSYKMFGIPLFSESRLATYDSNGGLNNILKRIISVTFQMYTILTIFFMIYKFKNFNFKIYTYLSVLILAIFSVLSGSKGAFIIFGFSFFIVSIYSTRWGDFTLIKDINKFLVKFMFIAILLAAVVVLFSENVSNPFEFLLLRIAMTGDVYYMAYPNEVINKIVFNNSNWFVSLFASPLSLLGIIDRSEIPYPIGYSLMQYHNPSVLFKGPNARMNIFSYIYIGSYLAPLYCFIIGLITSFVRNKLFHYLPPNILGGIVYYLLLIAALKLEPDFHSALAMCLNYLFIVPFFLFISFLLAQNSKSYNYDS
tara:strand:+ start:1813 stop:3123 length:1311 start_codon:yes stop_codon:yes gene_type:complete